MAQMEAFNDFMSDVRQPSSGCLETLEYFKFMDFLKTLNSSKPNCKIVRHVCPVKKCVNLPLRKFNLKFFGAGSSHTGGILLLNDF